MSYYEKISVSRSRRAVGTPKKVPGALDVILNPMALQILEALPKVQGNPYVFVGKVQGNAIQNPMKAFKRIIARAGVESTFRCQDLRHSHASLIINHGGNLFDVQSALGHANSSISERYAHLSEESRLKTSHNVSNVVSGDIGKIRVNPKRVSLSS